ncbi:hypothetical protein QN277_010430 [Acacia crassicarpa]|uniref:Uncharacterized protein n=1 Tax=Acacia crassicarpa TaxID=499986 RepID=A0AAE1IPQ0_9FABA|nr:hypothetical protein QN277_010430 [Acacia crassicarpa]
MKSPFLQMHICPLSTEPLLSSHMKILFLHLVHHYPDLNLVSLGQYLHFLQYLIQQAIYLIIHGSDSVSPSAREHQITVQQSLPTPDASRSPLDASRSPPAGEIPPCTATNTHFMQTRISKAKVPYIGITIADSIHTPNFKFSSFVPSIAEYSTHQLNFVCQYMSIESQIVQLFFPAVMP